MKRFKEYLSEMPVITKQGKKVLADDKKLKDLSIEDFNKNVVFFRNGNKENMMLPYGWSLIYFMDSEESAKDMQEGKIPYLMMPQGSIYSRFRETIAPIEKIWKKNYQESGQEHILGLIQGGSTEEKIYIDVIAIKPGYRKNKIAYQMMNIIKNAYPNAKITTSPRTEMGQEFFKQFLNEPDEPDKKPEISISPKEKVKA